MKRVTLLAVIGLPLMGCGGLISPQGGASLAAGNYSGTVDQGTMGSAVLQLTVANNGTISGTATLLGKSSGAIVGKATLGSTSNVVGGFTLNGTYSFYLPPPPNTTWYGPLTISGTIPGQGVTSIPVQLVNGNTTYTGTISPGG